ncbi:MAG: homoserine kinase [Clostridia bacterium]|nr:homoserine kinase [Clostridia bacterium]
MITIKIPATSANVGSGFDSLGLAVTLYNEIHLEEYEGLSIRALDGANIPLDETNLVYTTIKSMYELCGKPFYGVRFGQLNNIPLSRGLGSSSACIIGGLLAANHLMKFPFNKREIIDLAASIEGHPDNTTPALLGGFVASVFDGKQVHFVRQELHVGIKFAALIPPTELETTIARGVLPKRISHKDAVYNLSRSALMSASLATGSYHNLRCAAGDRLHQDYRLPMIPGAERIMRMLDDEGVYCSYVSGAGSTIMAMVPGAQGNSFYSRFRPKMDEEGYEDWKLLMLDADNTGAICVESVPLD